MAQRRQAFDWQAGRRWRAAATAPVEVSPSKRCSTMEPALADPRDRLFVRTFKRNRFSMRLRGELGCLDCRRLPTAPLDEKVFGAARRGVAELGCADQKLAFARPSITLVGDTFRGVSRLDCS